MDLDAVPGPLRAKLGADATAGLLALLELSHEEARDAVTGACAERFERRVVEEVSALRVQNAQTESSMRQDMTRTGAELRQEVAQLGSDLRREMSQLASQLRQEMVQLGSELRQEMGQLGSELRQEMGLLRCQMADQRAELLKWAFLFWIGQVVAIGTIVGVMLRLSLR
ncbi:MAG TPA: hypothetical protein VM364_05630 [Vicinamibacterales bacterium]|nr:hypothetical protein [Vicinamibacterales bacterium]